MAAASLGSTGVLGADAGIPGSGHVWSYLHSKMGRRDGTAEAHLPPCALVIHARIPLEQAEDSTGQVPAKRVLTPWLAQPLSRRTARSSNVPACVAVPAPAHRAVPPWGTGLRGRLATIHGACGGRDRDRWSLRIRRIRGAVQCRHGRRGAGRTRAGIRQRQRQVTHPQADLDGPPGGPWWSPVAGQSRRRISRCWPTRPTAAASARPAGRSCSGWPMARSSTRSPGATRHQRSWRALPAWPRPPAVRWNDGRAGVTPTSATRMTTPPIRSSTTLRSQKVHQGPHRPRPRSRRPHRPRPRSRRPHRPRQRSRRPSRRRSPPWPRRPRQRRPSRPCRHRPRPRRLHRGRLPPPHRRLHPLRHPQPGQRRSPSRAQRRPRPPRSPRPQHQRRLRRPRPRRAPPYRSPRLARWPRGRTSRSAGR